MGYPKLDETINSQHFNVIYNNRLIISNLFNQKGWHGRGRPSTEPIFQRPLQNSHGLEEGQHHEQVRGRNGRNDDSRRIARIAEETSGRTRSSESRNRDAELDGDSASGSIHFRSLHSDHFAKHGLPRSWKVIFHSDEQQRKTLFYSLFQVKI